MTDTPGSGSVEAQEVTANATVDDAIIDLAYNALTKALEDNTSALNNIRTRTISLLGAATVFVAFSAGLGFINLDPARGEVTPKWVGVTLMLVLILVLILVLVVLHPVRWAFKWNAEEIVRSMGTGADVHKIKKKLVDAGSAALDFNSRALLVKSRASRGIVFLVTLAAGVLVVASLMV